MASTTTSRRRDAIVVAVALLAFTLTACGDRPASGPAASFSDQTASPSARGDGSDGGSLAARKALVGFVDETVRAAGGGLTFEVQLDARKAEDCHPEDKHNWTYSTFTSVTGARAAKLMKDVEAYWRSQGRSVESSDGALFVRFDDVKVVIGDVGTNGADGMSISGSTSCFPGDGHGLTP